MAARAPAFPSERPTQAAPPGVPPPTYLASPAASLPEQPWRREETATPWVNDPCGSQCQYCLGPFGPRCQLGCALSGGHQPLPCDCGREHPEFLEPRPRSTPSSPQFAAPSAATQPAPASSGAAQPATCYAVPLSSPDGSSSSGAPPLALPLHGIYESAESVLRTAAALESDGFECEASRSSQRSTRYSCVS